MFSYGAERERGTAVFRDIACDFFYLSVAWIIGAGGCGGVCFVLQPFGKNKQLRDQALGEQAASAVF